MRLATQSQDELRRHCCHLGTNTYGQTNPPAGLSTVVGTAAGAQHCLALQSNGIVAAWGPNNDGQTNVPAGLSNVMAIAAGDNHCVALLNNGTLVESGRLGRGRIFAYCAWNSFPNVIQCPQMIGDPFTKR